MKPFSILLVNCIDTASEVQTRYPSLGLGHLAASARQAFGKEVCMRIADRLPPEILRADPPNLVGLSSVSQNYGIAVKYAAASKAAGIPVLMGGPHISQLPRTLSADMDLAAIGEAENTFVELVRRLMDHGGRFHAEDLAKIPGVAFRDGDGFIETPLPSPIGFKTGSLDEIPAPARDLLRVDRHTNMFTSRGCPYKCLFCASTRYWPALRFFSAAHVAEEIRTLVERHDVKHITFHDDLFLANLPRLRELADLLDGNGVLKKGIRFSCSASVTTIGEETAELLKRMNVVTVAMGLESGNDGILKYLKGDAFSVEKNASAVRTLNARGIHAHGSFVIGSPPETRETIMDTHRFIRDMPLSIVNIYVLTPLPGTPVWEMAERAGLVSNGMDWSRLRIDFQRNWRQAVLLPGNLSREELYGLYRKLRSLRARKMLKSIWTHPFLREVPRYALRSAKQILTHRLKHQK